MMSLLLVPDDEEERSALVERLNERLDRAEVVFMGADAQRRADDLLHRLLSVEGYTSAECQMDICMGCGMVFDWQWGHDPIECDGSEIQLAEEINDYTNETVTPEELTHHLAHRNYCGELYCILTDLERQKKIAA